ncbi:hypothetical protein QBC46DRAFT_252839 [Diplogelasinospora grovesii]|uniref:Uncharacterized protein n=1 Tax=Diplogelasinospora grovesii TaxID=303347 RepID=A0AAN6NHC5_9PEZI|nr:hypothetical protein QBC46DRAFT_252839 [Diplogelasinospora grovesii]
MEGTLSVPPDRGTIIGRALWKTRYVVVGGAQREQPPQTASNKGLQASRGSTPKGLLKAPPDAIYLSIYKSKASTAYLFEDYEPIQQHAIGTITECQVQMIAHRKQGPILPTLVINIVPDPATDKLRKRRSSRTAGLTATKETSPTTLWFRSADEQYTLQEWAHFIQRLISPNMPDRSPISPMTPASPTFINPFASRGREPSDMQQRPSSGNPSSRATTQRKNSNQAYASRDRPLTYSESPSLHSKRSDLSSHASSMHPSHMGFQNYTTMHPTDLPSPAVTIGEYQGEFIEGWTSAQGRSSTLSSPVRGRDSIGSQIPPSVQSGMPSSSPPGPRETILDRAFQMRCIPGSDREVPGEEKLSSLARFDALMREVDERRKKREMEEGRARGTAAGMTGAAAAAAAAAELGGLKSAWDMDDDSDSDDEQGLDDVEEDSDEYAGELDGDPEDRFRAQIPPTAQRALEFIASRHESAGHHPPPSRSQGARSPLSYNHEALMALSNSGSSHLRPQTGYSNSRRRPANPQRTHSQPSLAGIISSSTSTAYAQPSNMSPADVHASFSSKPSAGGSVAGPTAAAVSGPPRGHEKRLSTSSIKRLSITEFTKRLSSSTSSLLLVQTNNSGSSSRGSNSDMDGQQQQLQQQPYHHLHPRAAPPPPHQRQQPQQQATNEGDRDSWEKRCGWRGSVGVFGSEGGFL